MLNRIADLVRWTAGKLASAALITALVLGAGALWLYLKDNAAFEQWRQDTLRNITGQRAKFESALKAVDARRERIAGEIAAEQQRENQADKVISELKSLDSVWSRLRGTPAAKETAARIAGVRKLRGAIEDSLRRKEEELADANWERDGLEVAIGKTELQYKSFEARRSKVAHYVETILDYEIGHWPVRLPVRVWLVIALAAYFVGPTVRKLVMYFAVAPIVMRGKPVRLENETPVMPQAGPSGVAVEFALRCGERLRIKERFLQASDEGLRRRTRFLLDWRIPLTCLATGLVELIEMSNSEQADRSGGSEPSGPDATRQGVFRRSSGDAEAAAPAGGRRPPLQRTISGPPLTGRVVGGPGNSEPDGRRRSSDEEAQWVTLSNQADPHSELAIVTVPDGGSIVLRPSFLAGVVTAEGHRLRIRRRWQLFRWQAWVTLQLRFFEFVGPCRLVISGSRGVRVEDLAGRGGAAVPARRTNQDATIGFTPNLDYRPARAETFWSYYRGMNPLFDDLFSGRGIFLCQQVATEGDAKRARRFWAGVWSGALKIFGL